MWVAALINPYGAPARVVEAVIAGRVTAVVTQQLLDELSAVLVQPKFRRWFTVADAIAFVESLGGTADVHPEPPATAGHVRDPGDDYLVALSVAADVPIVTGDADLLTSDLKPAAITPRQLLEQLSS